LLLRIVQSVRLPAAPVAEATPLQGIGGLQGIVTPVAVTPTPAGLGGLGGLGQTQVPPEITPD
jgi:hypothetical protein